MPLLVWLTVALLAGRASAQIRASHPRIYVTDASLASMKARWAAKTDAELNEVISYAGRRMANLASADTAVRGAYPDDVIVPTALAALVTGEQRYVDATFRYLDIVMGIAPATGGDTAWRNRMIAMAVVYDWLYPKLSATRRTQAQNAMVAHMQQNSGFLDDADFVGGHSRWANVVSLATCIALNGHESRITGWCETTVANWKQGYVPALAFYGKDGGHHMGWMYGSSYTGIEPQLMWWSATGELWNREFIENSTYFMLYGMDENFDVPLSGDNFGVYVTKSHRNQLAASAALTGNGYAESLSRRLPAIWGPHAVIRAIVKNSVAPKAPTDLPLARHFSGSGFVVARSTWTETPALLVFKSSPFYSYNHHHRDENSLTLSYKGPLLTDGGFYDSYGSTHHKNFFSRSIAHNTLLVDMPGEAFRGAANDGGQHIPPSWGDEPTSVADLLGASKLDGIERFSQRDGVMWTRGNAGAAYVPAKVTTYLRDVIFVPRPDDRTMPIMLVVDQVKLPTARVPRIAWHMARAPVVDGVVGARLASPEGGTGRITFLAPQNRTVRSFSGAQRYVVAGANQAPTTEDTGTPPYWGRLEVAAPATTATTFSSVISVDESAGVPNVARASGAGFEGARIGRSLVVVATGTLAAVKVGFARSTVSAITVAGLAPRQAVDVAFSDGTTRLTADAQGLATGQPGASNPPPPADPAQPLSIAPPLGRAAADGNLTEYGDATPIVLKVANGASGALRATWDATHLYIGLECKDANLTAAQTTRDANLWLDDGLELMFDVRNDGGSVQKLDDRKLFVSVKGTQRDEEAGSASRWNGVWRSSVSVDGTLTRTDDVDEGYQIELAIPWTTLGVTPRAGLKLGFEVKLNDVGPNHAERFAVWSNADGGDVNSPAGWGEVVLASSAGALVLDDALADDSGELGPSQLDGDVGQGCAGATPSQSAMWLVIALLGVCRRRR